LPAFGWIVLVIPIGWLWGIDDEVIPNMLAPQKMKKNHNIQKFYFVQHLDHKGKKRTQTGFT